MGKRNGARSMALAMGAAIAAIGVTVVVPVGVAGASSVLPGFDFGVRSLGQVTGMATDVTTNGLIVALGPGATESPGMIARLDPITGDISDARSIGDGARTIVTSDDGQFLYVTMINPIIGASVKQVRSSDLSVMREFTIDVDGLIEPTLMVVQPGNPEVVAIVHRTPMASTMQVTIFDQGVARANAFTMNDPKPRLAWGVGGRLYVSHDDTTDRLSVDDTGVSFVSNIAGSPSMPLVGWANGYIYDTALRYGSEAPYAAWQQMFVHTGHHGEATATLSAERNRMYFASKETNEEVRWLDVFDLDTGAAVGSYRMEVSSSAGVPMDGTLVTWGDRGVAFVTAAGDVYVIDTELDYGSLGEYTPVSPARVLDTRDGTGRSGVAGKLAPSQQIDVQIAGLAGLPSSGVDAVVLNATVTAPTADGYLTVWPSGGTRPEISNVNFVPGATVPNLVIVGVGANGKVSAFNSAGTTDVIFDVAGYFSTATGPVGSRFHPLSPVRLFDTRTGEGGVLERAVGPRERVQFQLVGAGGVPAGATAVVMNVTVTDPTADSFLTVYPDDVTRPTASNLNFRRGVTVPNLVIVRVPASGVVDFYNDSGSTHVLADVVGYFSATATGEQGRLVSVNPFRDYDSRRDSSPFPPPGKILAGYSLIFDYGEPLTGVVMNVTVTEPTAPSYLTVYPEPGDVPNASNLNFVAGQTIANLVIARPNPELGFYNDAGSTHVIIDVFAVFS